MTLDEINVLGNIFNTTYGRSSTAISPTSSTTVTMQGDTAIVKFVTQMKMLGGSHDRPLIQTEREKAEKILKKFVSDTEKAFKRQCGRDLKMKVANTSDYVDPVSFPSSNGIGYGFFKMTKIYNLK